MTTLPKILPVVPPVTAPVDRVYLTITIHGHDYDLTELHDVDSSVAVRAWALSKLADVLGQPAVVSGLATFAAAPYPTSFLFAGESGTGKTSAAHALARELGIDADSEEMGGLYEVPSGELTADAVRAAMKNLHYT